MNKLAHKIIVQSIWNMKKMSLHLFGDICQVENKNKNKVFVYFFFEIAVFGRKNQ